MDQSAKLTKSQHQQIIFNYLKGKQDPLYDVSETKYGKYIVKPKQLVEEEEEEAKVETHSEEEESTQSSSDDEPQIEPVKQRKQVKRNQRVKQDAKRILDALTSIINETDSSDDDYQQAPPLVEPNNFHPQQLSFRRRRLAF